MDDEAGPGRQPGVGRALAMLAFPAVLLTLLIIGYVVVSGGEVSEPALQRAVPYLIAANHTVVFCVLLWVLHREGRTMSDIGWRLGGRSIGGELVLGVASGVAMYLVKELAFDSIRMLVEGARPTFTSLFRFSYDPAELPLLVVATTFIAVEESVYRGYGLGPLVRRFGVAGGLLLMGALFGLLHWGNGGLAVLFTGTIGVGLGGMYLWRGTLTAVLVAHAAYNALVILT